MRSREYRELWVSSVKATFAVTVEHNKEEPMKSVIRESANFVKRFHGQPLRNLINWLKGISDDFKMCSIPLRKNDEYMVPDNWRYEK